MIDKDSVQIIKNLHYVKVNKSAREEGKRH